MRTNRSGFQNFKEKDKRCLEAARWRTRTRKESHLTISFSFSTFSSVGFESPLTNTLLLMCDGHSLGCNTTHGHKDANTHRASWPRSLTGPRSRPGGGPSAERKKKRERAQVSQPLASRIQSAHDLNHGCPLVAACEIRPPDTERGQGQEISAAALAMTTSLARDSSSLRLAQVFFLGGGAFEKLE